MEYVFTMKMSVRDYECDLQGIVNNANYLHYIEHTRHEFLKHAGANFAELHQNGIDAVVARMNLQYKRHCAATTPSNRASTSPKRVFVTLFIKTSTMPLPDNCALEPVLMWRAL